MKPLMKMLIAVLVLISAGIVPSSHASNADHRIVDVGKWYISLAAGIGQLQNPLHKEQDIPQYLLPDIRYYSSRWSIENLDVSFVLKEKKDFVIELTGEQNMDGVYFPGDFRDGYGAFSGMHSAAYWGLDQHREPVEQLATPSHRSMSYMGGFEIRHYGWLNTFVNLQSDISNVHQGQQIRVEVQKDHQLGKFHLAFALKLNHQSNKMVNYYYGFDFRDTPIEALHYKAESSTNYQVQVNAAYPIKQNLAAVVALRQSWFGDGISDSPVVERDKITSYFAGVKYAF